MAIDTAAKRASATGFVVPTAIAIFPDGTIERGDSQAATWIYSGIAATLLGMVELTLSTRSPAMRLLSRSPALTIESRTCELVLPEI